MPAIRFEKTSPTTKVYSKRGGLKKIKKSGKAGKVLKRKALNTLSSKPAPKTDYQRGFTTGNRFARKVRRTSRKTLATGLQKAAQAGQKFSGMSRLGKAGIIGGAAAGAGAIGASIYEYKKHHKKKNKV